MFKMQDQFFINEQGKVMEIDGNMDIQNRNIVMKNRHGRINQQWDLIYADQYPDEPTKGQLNKEFGLYVERDFFIISAMASRRYVEVIDNRNIVIKIPNGMKGQKWYFHQPTKTIRTRLNNQSFDIQSSGKSNNL
jgi:hypothetical protein